MIRVLRLMEYIYEDNEAAQNDMDKWAVPAVGTFKPGPNKTIRSTIITDLTFLRDSDD